jgi:hypothetical protein
LIPLRLGKKPHKYKAKPLTVDGIRFDSTAEAKHYAELKILERAGEITELTVHPRYPIIINKRQVCIVELDFSYRDKEGHTHFIDCKGMDTAISKLKRKLVFAVHAITVEIVR